MRLCNLAGCQRYKSPTRPESQCFILSSWGQSFAPQASCPHPTLFPTSLITAETPQQWEGGGAGGWSQRLTGGSNSLFPINDCALQDPQRGTMASEHYGALSRLNSAAVGGAICTNNISISVGAPALTLPDTCQKMALTLQGRVSLLLCGTEGGGGGGGFFIPHLHSGSTCKELHETQMQFLTI